MFCSRRRRTTPGRPSKPRHLYIEESAEPESSRSMAFEGLNAIGRNRHNLNIADLIEKKLEFLPRKLFVVGDDRGSSVRSRGIA